MRMRFLLVYEQALEGSHKSLASDANDKIKPGSAARNLQGETMKRNNLFGILAMVTFSLLAGVPNMSAQMIATATVPFAFTVGHTEMPAGNYVISSVSDSAIAIMNRNKGTGVISLFRPEEPKRNDGATKLVFHKYGDKYFLSQVARGFGGNMIQLPTSKLEREVQIQSARSGSDREIVVAAK